MRQPGDWTLTVRYLHEDEPGKHSRVVHGSVDDLIQHLHATNSHNKGAIIKLQRITTCAKCNGWGWIPCFSDDCTRHGHCTKCNGTGRTP